MKLSLVKPCVAALAALTLTLQTFAAEPTGRSWKELREEGLQALQANKFEEAERLLVQAVGAADRDGKADRDLITSLTELADFYLTTEEPAKAEPHLRQAQKIRESIIGTNRIENVLILLPLATACRLQAKYDEATAIYERSQRIIELKLGKYHPGVAMCMVGLAAIHEKQGRPEKAEPLYKRAVELASATRHNVTYQDYGDPGISTGGAFYRSIGRPNYQMVAGYLRQFGEFYLAQNRAADAEKIFERQVKVVESEVSKDRDSLVLALNQLSTACVAQKKFPQADKALQRVLTMEAKQPGLHPVLMGETFHRLASLRLAEQKISEADAFLERLFRLPLAGNKAGFRNVAVVSSLAGYYARSENAAAAEELLSITVKIKEAVFGAGDPRTAPFTTQLGKYYYLRKDYNRAEELLKASLALGLKASPPDARNLLGTLNALLAVSNQKKDLAGNLGYARQIVQLIKDDKSNDLYEFLPLVERMIRFSRGAKNDDDTVQLYRHTIAIYENTPAADPLDLAAARGNLAAHHLEMKRPGLAEPLLVQALAAEEKARGADNMVLLPTLNKLATIYTEAGKDAELVKNLEQQIAIYEGLMGPKNAALIKPLTDYAAALKRLKRDADAGKIEARLKEIPPVK